jgi:glycosyltransferase involved in cell wall biosynthesis
VSEPLFSIVIACYNHENFIRETVESALQQPHLSKEVIVVDDASSDKTADVLSSFGDAIVFERLSANGGASAARNHGASRAKGKYLVFLDGDDVLAPWTLSVYARIIGEREPMIILGRSRLFHGSVPTLSAGSVKEIRFVEYGTFLDKDRPWVYNSSSLIVERKAFSDAGGWAPDIFYQDIQDLLNKLGAAGATELILAPDTVLYRMHSTNAVRKIAPFIEGIYRLLEKEKRGAYPSGRFVQRKRSAWFGGLIFFWGLEGMRNGHFRDGLRVVLSHWWMVLMALIRRALVRITGRRPIEVLTLEPNESMDAAGSHPARPLASGHSG